MSFSKTINFVSGYWPESAFKCAIVPNMASADLNNDGLEDILVSGWTLWSDNAGNIVSQPAYLKAFIQQPDGTLLDQTSQLFGVTPQQYSGSSAGQKPLDLLGATGNIIYGSQRILVDDYDLNGYQDIFLPGFQDGDVQNQPSVMFWNEGSQFTRQNFTEPVWSHGALKADLNFDGLIDLWVPGFNVGGIYLNQGNRQFSFHYMGEGYAAMQLLEQSNGISKILVTNNYGPSGYGNANGSFDWIIEVDRNLNILESIPFPDTLVDTVDDVDIGYFDINFDNSKDLIIGSQRGAYARVYLNDGTNNFTQTYSYRSVIDPKQWPGYYNKIFTIGENTAFFTPGGGNPFAGHLYVFTPQGVNDYGQQFSDFAQSIAEQNNQYFSLESISSYVYQNSLSGKTYSLMFYPYYSEHEFWTTQLSVNNPTGHVAINGVTTQGQELIAYNNINDLDGVGAISYQWQSNEMDIPGAISESYFIKRSDIGKSLTVVAKYIDGGGLVENIYSASTAPVKAYVEATYASPASAISSIGMSADLKYLLVRVDGLTKSVASDSSLSFDGILFTANDLLALMNPTPVFKSSGGSNGYALPEVFTGPASLNLDYQLIETGYNAVVIGGATNDFIKVSSTNSLGKAVDGGAGNDVIDGGVGSAFISGGTGSDTIFLDGRAAGVSWSTVTDFTFGQDKATIWGWKAGISKVSTLFTDFNTGGAPGYTGLTLHFENLLPDDAAPGQTNSNFNSITLTGLTLADFGATSLETLNAQITAGTNSNFITGQTTDEYGVHGYLFLS